MAEIVKLTTQASIIVQALSTVFGVKGILTPVPASKQVLVNVLKLEMLVTSIQLAWYVNLYKSFDLASMATRRYSDWFITTPLMILSMAVYYIYESKKTFTFEKYKKPLVQMFVANFIMLLAGFLAEKGLMDRTVALGIGFAAFGFVFKKLYDEFRTEESDEIYKLLTSVWALYGLAFMLPDVQKNIMYNGLDLISKNFFAFFLYRKIVHV
jgi:bacteriorhodopsin